MTGNITKNPTDISPAQPRCAWKSLAPGAEINQAAWSDQASRFLQPSLVSLLTRLHRELDGERRRLLAARDERQQRFNAGAVPDYLPEGASVRGRDWRVAPLPPDLLTRRVEITGPVNDTKMVINMLCRNEDGQRADAAMLDFEDSMKPTWQNVMDGVDNLVGAANNDLTFEKRSPTGDVVKRYAVDASDMPLLMVRCRGLHLDESNLRIDDTPISGGLLDLALSAFHTAEVLSCRGKTPKYYVPKCEHYLEARWWNALFRRLEGALSLPRGTLRATFLIETLPAAFQMEEILFEIRERAAGLNVGRWDKIFSDIKVLREHPDRVLADRASISLNRPWMKAYAEALINICHRRGALAMGGMAAFTPGKTAERRQEQTRKVVADKEFEYRLGHDGCWVSHPYFIGPALSSFVTDNQIDRIPPCPERPDLLPAGSGPRTLDGLRTNVRVGIGYLRGWNEGIGCVAWDDLMEDLATLEISRAQIWQWLRHAVVLDDGTEVTRDLVLKIFDEELQKIIDEVRTTLAEATSGVIDAEVNAFALAKRDAAEIFTEEQFRSFLSTRSELVPD
ncbi:MAG: malate synthase [Acidobacteriota bacterium]|nr:malate synthase [Acidobacteriota bacterium]